MLSKINRLKNTAEIGKVFKGGKGFKDDFLFLKLAANNLSVTRFAFIVSKKIDSKASARNKIKRRLREIIRREALHLKPGFDAVLVAQSGIKDKNFQEIGKGAVRLLKKSKLI